MKEGDGDGLVRRSTGILQAYGASASPSDIDCREDGRGRCVVCPRPTRRRVAVRVGHPLRGGDQRRHGGLAVGVQGLGHHEVGARCDPDGPAGGPAAGPGRVSAQDAVVEDAVIGPATIETGRVVDQDAVAEGTATGPAPEAVGPGPRACLVDEAAAVS